MKFQPPRGTRDIKPDEMFRRNYVLDVLRETFERWGFLPLQTPAFESWKLLSAKCGEDVKNEIYYFKDKSNRELGLRFEFTTSLARFISNNPNIPKPFKRYQIGPVWRYDRPSKGRYREFWQADIDIVGSSSPLADAEVVSTFANALENLGIKDFTIKINNRKIIESFLLELGIKNTIDVLRSIDKLEKFGKDFVVKELKRKGVSGDSIKKIINFISKDLKKDNENKGIKELLDVVNYIKSFGYGKYVKIDLSLVRGLDYYTGVVFEFCINDALSIAGGGRYDNLIKTLGGPNLPATGISFGIDRLIEFVKFERKENIFFIVPIGKINDAIKIAKKLRKAGIKCDLDVSGRGISNQLRYAARRNIRYVLIVGEKELKKNGVKLRDMKTGSEKLIKINNLVSKLRKL